MIGSREGAQHLPLSPETRAGMKGEEGPHARSGLLVFFPIQDREPLLGPLGVVFC